MMKRIAVSILALSLSTGFVQTANGFGTRLCLGADDPPTICSIDSVKLERIDGRLPSPAATYTLTGRCRADYDTSQWCSGDGKPTSNFDDVKVWSNIAWTATGSYDPNIPLNSAYNPLNREKPNTVETISLSDTRVDRPGYVARGTLTASMVCKKDPWRDPAGGCYTAQYQTSGTVDADIVGVYARGLSNPHTSFLSPERRAALNTAYNEAVRKAQLAVKVAPVSGSTVTQNSLFFPLIPSVLAPTARQLFVSQTPIAIKIAPPKGWNVANYVVNIQTKNANGVWVAHATIPVSAAQAQSAAGYTGFGAGAPPAFLSVPGSWRLNAQASYPKQSGPSEWVEFSVMRPNRIQKK